MVMEAVHEPMAPRMHATNSRDSSPAPAAMAPAANSKIVVDLFAGTVAGTAQLMVGHPFDTVKVKLQSQASSGGAAQYSGAMDAVRKTVMTEGLAGLYRGLGAPLATVALFNAVLFSSRGQMELLLAHRDGSRLTVADQMVGSVGASVAVSLVACPTELLKCRLQAQGSAQAARERLAAAGADPSTVKVYRGPMDVARHVVATEGGARGLMRGLVPTLGREVPGNIAMFGTYEYLKVVMARSQGLQGPEQLGKGSLLMAGGTAGTAFWLACYPVDVIKSRWQLDTPACRQYSSLLDCARQIARHEGLRGFWKGFSPALARSFPANAACFAAYEATLQATNRALGYSS